MKPKLAPSGGERLARAYLAAILTAFGAGLWGVIAWQIADQIPACSADETGSCSSLWGGLATVLGYLGILAGMASLLRLGRRFWVPFAAGVLLVTQVVVESGMPELLALVLLLPAIAALASDPARSGALRGRRDLVLDLAGAAVLVEFALWLLLLLLE